MKHIKLFEDWTKDYSDAIKKAYAEYAIVSIISDYKYKQKGQKPVTWKRGTEMLASLGTGPRGGINIRSVKEGGFEVTPAEFKKHWTIVDKISKDEFWKLVKKLPSGFDDPVLPSGFRINEISSKVITLDEGKKLKGWDYTGTITYSTGKRGIYYQYPNNIKYYVEVTPEEYDDYLEGGSLKKKLEKKWADSGRAMSQDEFRRKYPLKGMDKYLSQGGRMWD